MSICVPLLPAPSSPLNLTIGAIYAPRVEAPPFVGYSCREIAPDRYDIVAYEVDGRAAVLARRVELGEAYTRLATHLRMDVAL